MYLPTTNYPQLTESQLAQAIKKLEQSLDEGKATAADAHRLQNYRDQLDVITRAKCGRPRASWSSL